MKGNTSRYLWVTITLAIITVLTAWSLNVLSSDRVDWSLGLWSFEQSPAREIAGAILGGVVVGLLILMLDLWVNREADLREQAGQQRRADDRRNEEVRSDDIASGTVAAILQSLVTLEAGKEASHNNHLERHQVGRDEEELLRVVKGWMATAWWDASRSWPSGDGYDPGGEGSNLWNGGLFSNEILQWCNHEPRDEHWEEWRNPEVLGGGEVSFDPDLVWVGSGLAFASTLARVRARAIIQLPEKAGILLAQVRDTDRLEAFRAATVLAGSVINQMGDHKVNVFSRVVHDALADPSLFERYGFPAALDFLECYSDLDRVLAGAPSNDPTLPSRLVPEFPPTMRA